MRAILGFIAGVGICTAILASTFGYSNPQLNFWFALAVIISGLVGAYAASGARS